MTRGRDEAQSIEDELPPWRVFRSDAGRWWASDPTITNDLIRADCSATVTADTAEELRREIRQQQAQQKAVLDGTAPSTVSLAAMDAADAAAR